jgi:alpha-ketoglutarate-dependent taurine dioxygenase
MHQNGWTPIVTDLDWREINQEQVNQLAKLLLTNTVVVTKKQELTPADEVRITSMFGNVEYYNAQNGIGVNTNFILKDSSDKILRVTGEKNDHGEPGMFGHVTELDWHCNRVTWSDRKPIIWLFGERGTKGSRTSYINFQMVYQDLTDAQKEQFENLELDVGDRAFQEYYSKVKQDRNRYYPRLVQTNVLGIKALFMPFNQVHFIKDWDQQISRKFIEELRDNLILNEKYMYHHDWDDGDVVIAEQWSGIHKRWEFEHMDKRVLHRIATDFANTPYA